MNNVSSIRIMHDTPLIIKCLYISFLVGKIREMYPKEMHEEYTGFKVNPIYGGMGDTANSSKPHRDFNDADEASTVQQQSGDTSEANEDSFEYDTDDEIKTSNVGDRDKSGHEVGELV